MTFDAYYIRLHPEDGGLPHLVNRVGSGESVGLLSHEKVQNVRDLLLGGKELGRTVGKNGVDGEGYVVLTTFPNLDDLHKLWLSCQRVRYEDFYISEYKMKKAHKETAAAAASAANV